MSFSKTVFLGVSRDSIVILKNKNSNSNENSKYLNVKNEAE